MLNVGRTHLAYILIYVSDEIKMSHVVILLVTDINFGGGIWFRKENNGRCGTNTSGIPVCSMTE